MCKTTDLSIIILNYNGQYWLERALRSIEKNYLPFTIYRVGVTVVDNASTDHSVDFLKTIDWVRLIEADHNGGYAYGNNLALRENTSRYVLLLNNDTEFTKYTSNLDLLVEYMDKHPQTGIITPRVELANGHIDKACHRGEPKPWIALSYLTGLEKLFPKSRFLGRYHQGFKNMDKPHTVDSCSGAVMFIRTSAIKKTGLLDERFFMYGEDLDWCKRFRESGYQIIYHPGASVIHHKYKSGIENDNQDAQKKAKSWFYNSMLLFYEKHYSSTYPQILNSLIRWLITAKCKYVR